MIGLFTPYEVHSIQEFLHYGTKFSEAKISDEPTRESKEDWPTLHQTFCDCRMVCSWLKHNKKDLCSIFSENFAKNILSSSTRRISKLIHKITLNVFSLYNMQSIWCDRDRCIDNAVLKIFISIMKDIRVTLRWLQTHLSAHIHFVCV